MRQKELKYFGEPQQGRINADDSPFAVGPNEWVNAENVRTGSTDKGFTGVVESVGGNVALTFGYVNIGGQKWMTENLNVAHFKNGDEIPVITDPVEWAAADYAACCFYDNDPRNQNEYGKLYNWYAVTDPRGLAPDGWRVPSGTDFDNLVNLLGTDAGGKAKTTGFDFWIDPNTGATNESNLSMKGHGYRDFDGEYGGQGEYGDFWTIDEASPTDGYECYLTYDSADFTNNNAYNKTAGFAVRLIYDSNRYITIGTVEDTENERLVYFNYDTDPERNDQIMCLYTKTNTIYKVIDSSQVIGGLNFSKYSLIHSAKITDNLLSWVDGTNNEPRKLNIDSAIAGNTSLFDTDARPYVYPLNFSEITMIKPPPIYCPNIQKLVDPTFINNFIATKSFEFSFMYQYYDNEKSVVGSYSIATRLDIQDASSNYIQVDMDGNEVIPYTVRKVFLIARVTDGSSNNGNTAFVARTWDRNDYQDSLDIDNQNNGVTVLTHNFYNETTGETLAPDDVIRPYDLVPMYSHTHEVAKSRYFLGNNINGYDTPKISSLSVEANNNSTNASSQSFQLYKLTIQSTSNIAASKQWAFKGYLVFDGMDYWIFSTAGSYAYTLGSNTLPADPTQPTAGVPINAVGNLVKVGYTLFTIVNKLFPKVSGNTLVLPSPVITDGTSYTNIRTIELIKPVKFVIINNLLMSGYTVYAQQSPYKFGVVFYDYAMRKCGVIGNVKDDELNQVYEYTSVTGTPSQLSSLAPDALYTPLAQLNVVQIGDTLVISDADPSVDGTYVVTNMLPGQTGFQVAPSIATIGVTLNVVIKVYRQLRIELTTPTATSGLSGYVNNIRWQLSNFDAVNEIPDWAYYYSIVRTLNLRTRYFIQSYTSSARYFTKNIDGTWNETNPVPGIAPQGAAAIGLPIDNLLRNGLGYTYEPENEDICILYANSVGGAISVNLPVVGAIGNYILVKFLDLGDSPYGPGIDKMNIWYEVYHPYKPVEQEPYFEVGEIYPINNPKTISREYSTLYGNLRGDCARISRYISQGANFNNTFYAVGMCANDLYYQRWDNDGGKINVITNYGRTENPSAVSFSDAIISGSSINGTSTFRANNLSYVPADCGSITKLQLTSKIQNEGTVMLGLCTSEITSMYLGEQQIIDSTGGTKFFGASSNVISTINTLKGNYGCINPESVVQYRGRVYFFDASNGRVLQYSENGIDPISSIKMSRFWKNWATQYLSMTIEDIEYYGDRPYVFAIVDPFHDELLLSIPTLSDIPPKGYLPDYPQMIYPFDILDYQGKTMAYNIGLMANINPHWQGAFMFNTDYFGSVQNKVLSFRDGLPYLHNQDTQNTFFDVYTPSKIMFTSNSIPQVPKVYDNFLSESNLIPNFVYFYNDNPFLQTSDLGEVCFRNVEGVWYASILRNKIVPTSTGFNIDGLLTAEVMRNRNMYIMTQFLPTTSPLELRIVQIAYSISKGHNF